MQSAVPSFIFKDVATNRSARKGYSTATPRLIAATVVCSRCAYQWIATPGYGAGALRQVLGGFEVSCTNCRATAKVLLSQMGSGTKTPLSENGRALAAFGHQQSISLQNV